MKIGFIGCGNMGGAILQGILQGGTPAADIYVADHNLETLRQKLGHTGVQICRAIRKWRRFVTLSFWRSSRMCYLLFWQRSVRFWQSARPCPFLISIAAGKSTAYLEDQLGSPLSGGTHNAQY